MLFEYFTQKTSCCSVKTDLRYQNPQKEGAFKKSVSGRLSKLFNFFFKVLEVTDLTCVALYQSCFHSHFCASGLIDGCICSDTRVEYSITRHRYQVHMYGYVCMYVCLYCCETCDSCSVFRKNNPCWAMMFKITQLMWKKTNNQSNSIMFHVKYLVSTPVSKVKCKYSFSSPSVKQWYQRIPTYYILQQVRSTNYDRPMNNLSAVPKLQLQSERDMQCSPSLNHQSDSHPLHPAQQITRLYFIKKNPSEPIIVGNPISSFVTKRKGHDV